MAQQNLKQPWMPLRRLGQAVKQGFHSKDGAQVEADEDNPWFRLARESSWSTIESENSDLRQDLPSEVHQNPEGRVRWVNDGTSPYGFSDEDGTLKQVDSSNWRRMLGRNRTQRFVPVESRWQGVASRNQEWPVQRTGSTWLLQSLFAVGLVGLGLYASHSQTALASEVQSVYKSVFTKNYSTMAGPAIDQFLSTHHLPIPAWAQSGAIRLHVPMTGSIVTDYSPQHPEMVIQGTPHEAILSAGSGVVAKAQALSSGSMVVIDHGKLGVSIYDGLGSLAVHQGEYVNSGQVLGHLPGSGHPQLRFSIEQNGHYVNPHDYIVFPSSGA